MAGCKYELCTALHPVQVWGWPNLPVFVQIRLSPPLHWLQSFANFIFATYLHQANLGQIRFFTQCLVIQPFLVRESVLSCLNMGITGCQFTKNMTAAQVEIRIMEVFEEKIPRLVDIELLMSVHTALVKPNLAPDQQGIDGVILHRLFKNKLVYIRPSCELLDSTQMERRESRVTIISIIFIIITYLKTVTLHHTYLYV